MLDYTQLQPVTERIEFPSDMTAEEFMEYCAAYRHIGARMERNPDGSIVMEPPVNLDSGYSEGKAFSLLVKWDEQQSYKSGMVINSNTGFVLDNGAIRSPDAAWISIERVLEVPKADRRKFLPKCPEFVIEIISSSDSLKKVKTKMEEWINNGALLAWLIDPSKERAWIYRAGGSVEEVNGFEGSLNGEDVLPGFALELKLLRFPF